MRILLEDLLVCLLSVTCHVFRFLGSVLALSQLPRHIAVIEEAVAVSARGCS